MWKPFLQRIPIRVAVDVWQPALESWIEPGWIPIKQDVTDLSIFIDKSFDIVVGLDIIEHLEREAGEIFLDEIDRIAKKAAIIFAPVSFLDVRIYQAEYIKNDYDLHRSGWYQEDLEKRGYTVATHEGLHHWDDDIFDAMTGVKLYIDGLNKHSQVE
jgi:hypothetical protein